MGRDDRWPDIASCDRLWLVSKFSIFFSSLSVTLDPATTKAQGFSLPATNLRPRKPTMATQRTPKLKKSARRTTRVSPQPSRMDVDAPSNESAIGHQEDQSHPATLLMSGSAFPSGQTVQSSRQVSSLLVPSVCNTANANKGPQFTAEFKENEQPVPPGWCSKFITFSFFTCKWFS